MTAGFAFVVNPASGRGRAARIAERAAERLRAGGATVRILASRSAAHARELAAAAASSGGVVVAVGGDGTVAEVANGVLGTGATLGIVPSGSGNDFAAHLGYARRDPLSACEALLAGRTREVDVGRIEGGRAFLCVAGAGFDSECNREANRIRWARGTLVYVVAVLRTLRRFRPAPFRVTLDGRLAEMDGMFVAVGNARSYGGGMRIAPDAMLDDGLFDVCLVGAMSRADLVMQFPRLFKGTHVRHPGVVIVRAVEVTIASGRPFLLYADGEEIGPLPVTLRVEPRALRCVVP